MLSKHELNTYTNYVRKATQAIDKLAAIASLELDFLLQNLLLQESQVFIKTFSSSHYWYTLYQAPLTGQVGRWACHKLSYPQAVWTCGNLKQPNFGRLIFNVHIVCKVCLLLPLSTHTKSQSEPPDVAPKPWHKVWPAAAATSFASEHCKWLLLKLPGTCARKPSDSDTWLTSWHLSCCYAGRFWKCSTYLRLSLPRLIVHP